MRAYELVGRLALALEGEPRTTLEQASRALGISRSYATKLRHRVEKERGVKLCYDKPEGVWRVLERGDLPMSCLTVHDIEAMMMTIDEACVRHDGMLAPRAVDAVRRLARQLFPLGIPSWSRRRCAQTRG